MGARDDALEAAAARHSRDEGFEVYADCIEAVRLFLACGTQWKVVPLGGVAGLDYPGVEALCRMSGIDMTSALFRDLQTMEAAALPLLNERADST